MKSKFKFGAYLIAVLSMFCTGLIYLVLSGEALNKNMAVGPFFVFSSFFVFVWIWIFFGEFRLKAISFEINDDMISIRHYLGVGIRKVYEMSFIDGYSTSILTSKSGYYEYLYLYVDGKKIAKISEFYHANYHDLKKEIIAYKIKNKGFEQFSYIQELKEIFV